METANDPYCRSAGLGLSLATAPRPVANDVSFALAASMLSLSGQGRRKDNGRCAVVRLRERTSIEDACAPGVDGARPNSPPNGMAVEVEVTGEILP